MEQLVVEVPPRVAEAMRDTVGWVREFLDASFDENGAVTEALIEWCDGIRVEFAGVDCQDALGAGLSVRAIGARLQRLENGVLR